MQTCHVANALCANALSYRLKYVKRNAACHSPSLSKYGTHGAWHSLNTPRHALCMRLVISGLTRRLEQGRRGRPEGGKGGPT